MWLVLLVWVPDHGVVVHAELQLDACVCRIVRDIITLAQRADALAVVIVTGLVCPLLGVEALVLQLVRVIILISHILYLRLLLLGFARSKGTAHDSVTESREWLPVETLIASRPWVIRMVPIAILWSIRAHPVSQLVLVSLFHVFTAVTRLIIMSQPRSLTKYLVRRQRSTTRLNPLRFQPSQLLLHIKIFKNKLFKLCFL